MKFEVFLKKNKIDFNSTVLDLCQKGLGVMAKPIDPLHGVDHLERLLNDLDGLLNSGEIKREEINWEVMLMSLCWHDVWRSRKWSNRPSKMLWYLLMDGWGSAFRFKREGKKAGIDKKTIGKVAYAIRKHPGIQFLKHKTLESKILRDIDRLDICSKERLKEAEKLAINKKRIMLAKFYFKRFMSREMKEKLFFDWTDKELKRRRVKLMSLVSKFLTQHKELAED